VAQQVRGSDSLLLALLPLVSVAVLTIRVVLGYIRMGDRWEGDQDLGTQLERLNV
jgi:hypothetical protein